MSEFEMMQAVMEAIESMAALRPLVLAKRARRIQQRIESARTMAQRVTFVVKASTR